jgi:hypothetical protein
MKSLWNLNKVALVQHIEARDARTPKRQAPVEAGFQVFEADGQTYLQIVTYGSSHRQMKGVVSQKVQFGPEGIAALRGILKSLP